jgi:hypothetical protein
MVIVNSQLPYLLNIRRSDNGKVNPVEPASKIPKYNNNDRSFNEQKKNDVKTAAAILRISEQGKSSAGINRIYKVTKRSGTTKRLQEK